jgi:uncharacterized protein (DUF934 family)
MPTLISRHGIERDDWQYADPETTDIFAGNRIVVPVAHAIAHTDAVFAADREVGVRLPGDAELDPIEPLLRRVALIAVDFPAFNDGRGLSLAVLLRTRCGFRGELRAVGDVHTDMMHYLERCGFDSYLLPDGRDPRTALDALSSLSDFYQGSVVQPLPAYRRIGRGGAVAGLRSRLG